MLFVDHIFLFSREQPQREVISLIDSVPVEEVPIHGTTFDGVRACWFSNTEPSNLPLMAQGLTLADEELRRRGWYL
ncbi:hypothetical protein JJJ17_06465 [Paracoccus caeni]|uniref:Uncharacterized protein n=1 Tax=Paracoccus caeni TaxID=657651 RepID=A0A934VZ82_9RHOB|nr:hypothetical protein [Paracoccus caeni]MBK4215565.1 hypothetical protein [Paracoccus caeni]